MTSALSPWGCSPSQNPMAATTREASLLPNAPFCGCPGSLPDQTSAGASSQSRPLLASRNLRSPTSPLCQLCSAAGPAQGLGTWLLCSHVIPFPTAPYVVASDLVRAVPSAPELDMPGSVPPPSLYLCCSIPSRALCLSHQARPHHLVPLPFPQPLLIASPSSPSVLNSLWFATDSHASLFPPEWTASSKGEGQCLIPPQQLTGRASS